MILYVLKVLKLQLNILLVHSSFALCKRSIDIIVFTVEASCSQGAIHLAGSYSYQGRVEVCYNNIWGTVCDDGWSRNDGIVACRQLGLSFVRVVSSAYFGRGIGRIWLDDVTCTGSESRLVNCRHRGFGVHNCGHSEDAGVVCARRYFDKYNYMEIHYYLL